MNYDTTMNHRKEIFLAVAIMVLFVAASYYGHIRGGSTLVQTDDIWENRLLYHTDTYPPSTRPFTSGLIKVGTEWFGLSVVNAFSLVHFTLYFIIGLAFYRFLRALDFTVFFSLAGMIVLAASYPMLFAHFQPVYTWDDFWQYLAIILALLFILRERPLLASVVFTLGLIAREALVILYPAYLFALLSRFQWRSRDVLIGALLPLVCFGFYYWLNYQPLHPERFSNFAKNFLNSPRAANTVFSLIVCFGVVWVSSSIALVSDGRKLFADSKRSFIVIGALYSVPVTILTTLTMTLARETRIFFPPFIFLIPLSLYFVSVNIDLLKKFYTRLHGIPGIVLAIAAVWFGQVLAVLLFPEFDFRAGKRITQIYFGLHLAAVILFISPLIERAVSNTVRLQQQLKGMKGRGKEYGDSLASEKVPPQNNLSEKH